MCSTEKRLEIEPEAEFLAQFFDGLAGELGLTHVHVDHLDLHITYARFANLTTNDLLAASDKIGIR